MQGWPTTHLLSKAVVASPEQHHPAAQVNVPFPQHNEVTFQSITAIEDGPLEQGKIRTESALDSFLIK